MGTSLGIYFWHVIVSSSRLPSNKLTLLIRLSYSDILGVQRRYSSQDLSVERTTRHFERKKRRRRKTMDPQHDQVLPLQLVSEQDDAEARAIKSRLAVLVNLDDPSNVGPTQAAAEFDGWLMSEANRRLDIFLQRQGQDRYDVTLEEKQRLGTDSVRSLGPDTEGHLNDLFEGLAKLASSFPPFHPKQDRLLDFLTALAALPPRQAPNVTPLWRLYDGDELRVPDHPGWEMMNLWPFGDPGEDVTRLLVSSFEHEAECEPFQFIKSTHLMHLYHRSRHFVTNFRISWSRAHN